MPLTKRERLNANALRWYYRHHERVLAERARPENREIHRALARESYAKLSPEGKAQRNLRKFIGRRAVPWKPLLHAARHRANVRGLAFDLTKEWAASRYTGICEITGFPFLVDVTVKYQHSQPFSPSIDRIDSDLGYTVDNCRFVLWGVNSFRNIMSDDQMVKIARAIVKWADRPPVCVIAPSTDRKEPLS